MEQWQNKHLSSFSTSSSLVKKTTEQQRITEFHLIKISTELSFSWVSHTLAYSLMLFALSVSLISSLPLEAWDRGSQLHKRRSNVNNVQPKPPFSNRNVTKQMGVGTTVHPDRRWREAQVKHALWPVQNNCRHTQCCLRGKRQKYTL